MFEKFIVKLLAEAARNPDIQKFVADQIAALADHLKNELLPDIAGLLPTFGASLLKSVFEKLPGIPDLPGSVAELATESVEKLLESDPDIPGLSNIIDLSELARHWLGR